jgi:putative membrane protein
MKTLILTATLAAAVFALGARGAAQSTGKTADETFMKEAAAAGTAEVEVGQLAVEKASRPEVKSYAQMLVDDHTKANEELKGLAAQKNVTLPAEPTAEQKATKERLSKLSGDAFDRAYMDAMVSDHQKAVALFSRESKSGADPDAKAWAAKTLPKLEDHHTKAKSLASGKHEAQPHH